MKLIYKSSDLGKRIGGGAFGTVFSVKNESKLVLKILEYYEFDSIKKLTESKAWTKYAYREALIGAWASNHELAPKYYGRRIVCRKNKYYVAILIERIKRTYHPFLNSREKDILTAFSNVGIKYHDLHDGNVFKAKNKHGFVVVDFGIAAFSKRYKQKAEQWLKSWLPADAISGIGNSCGMF